MLEPLRISPLLDGFTVGSVFHSRNGVSCYPAEHTESGQRYILKKISIPQSRVQVDALLLSGAVSGEEAAASYFQAVADQLCKQVETLERLSQYRYFLPFAGHQLVPHEEGIGSDLYLLSEVGLTLSQWMQKHPMTYSDAINLGIDLCAALAVCREMGYLYADLNPNNIFISDSGNYCIGDLGFLSLPIQRYSAMPAAYLSSWSPPEVMDILSTPNTTMDTYALGMLLYQIFNGGVLPFSAGQPRPQELAPPAYADFRLGRLLLKAIDEEPAQRYADPVTMGRALLTYSQRVKISDAPIVPLDRHAAQKPESEPAPEKVPAVAEPPAPEEVDVPEDAAPVEETAAPETALPDEAPVLEETPAARNTLVLEFFAETEQKPQEAEAEPEQELEEVPIIPEINEETLKTNLNSILGEAPDAVAFDIPDFVFEQEPEVFEYPLDEEDFQGSEETPEPVPVGAYVPEEALMQSPLESDAILSKVDALIEELGHPEALEESPEEQPPQQPAEEAATEPVKKARHGKLGWIVVLLLLVLLAAGTAGGYYYYQHFYIQSIDALELRGSADKLIVDVTTDADNALLSVICQGEDGSTQTAAVVGGHASFSDLAPSTKFSLSVEIQGNHELVGALSATYQTPGKAEITEFFSTTGSSDGSAILVFTADGTPPQQWTLHYHTPGEEEKQISFTDTTTTLTGLSVGKTYTCYLSGDETAYLTGNTTLSFTASNVLLAQELTITNFADGILTASWNAPEDTTGILWHIQLQDSEGGEITRETRETAVTFEALNPELEYTLTVLADGMTKSTAVSVNAKTPALTQMNFSPGNATNLQVSWEFTGDAPESWQLIYTLDGGKPVPLATESTSVRVAPAAPGGHYTFHMRDKEGKLILNSSAEFEMPEAKTFSGYTVDAEDFSAQMFPTPEKENWGPADVRNLEEQTEYAPGDMASLLLYIKPKYGISKDSITAVTVIRDENGNAVILDSDTLPWSSMWNNHYGEWNLSQLPEEPGAYTVTLYFNGAFVLEKSFTIV